MPLVQQYSILPPARFASHELPWRRTGTRQSSCDCGELFRRSMSIEGARLYGTGVSRYARLNRCNRQRTAGMSQLIFIHGNGAVLYVRVTVPLADEWTAAAVYLSGCISATAAVGSVLNRRPV